MSTCMLGPSTFSSVRLRSASLRWTPARCRVQLSGVIRSNWAGLSPARRRQGKPAGSTARAECDNKPEGIKPYQSPTNQYPAYPRIRTTQGSIACLGHGGYKLQKGVDEVSMGHMDDGTLIICLRCRSRAKHWLMECISTLRSCAGRGRWRHRGLLDSWVSTHSHPCRR